jgi:hypothetical protein
VTEEELGRKFNMTLQHFILNHKDNLPLLNEQLLAYKHIVKLGKDVEEIVLTDIIKLLSKLDSDKMLKIIQKGILNMMS